MTQGLTLDKGTILDRLGGDEEIFGIMADMYLQDVDGYCKDLEAALASNDALQLRREAHTLKGLLATFADEDGAALAAALEEDAKAGGDIARLAPAVALVGARMLLVAEAVRQVRQG